MQYQDVEPEDSVMSLVEAFPRLLVLRTFSKIYGLSGVRAGYAVGSATATGLLSALAPALGVNALTQATVLQALKVGDPDVTRRRETVIEQRGRLLDELSTMAVTVPDSQANVLWIRAHEVPGADLVARLESSRVRVAGGEPHRRCRLHPRRDPRPPRCRPAAVGVARGAAWRRCRGSTRGMRAAAVATAVLVLAVLGGCGGDDKKPTGPQKLDLEIGNLVPKTGFLDAFGKPSERAADVAAEEIRKAAAKAGARHTVKLQTVDYKSDPNDRGRAREEGS